MDGFVPLAVVGEGPDHIGGVVHGGDHTHKVASAVEGKQLGDMPRRYDPPSLKQQQDAAGWSGKLRRLAVS